MLDVNKIKMFNLYQLKIDNDLINSFFKIYIKTNYRSYQIVDFINFTLSLNRSEHYLTMFIHLRDEKNLPESSFYLMLYNNIHNNVWKPSLVRITDLYYSYPFVTDQWVLTQLKKLNIYLKFFIQPIINYHIKKNLWSLI